MKDARGLHATERLNSPPGCRTRVGTPLSPAVLQIQFEGLALPVHGVAAFPPAVPHVPRAAKIAVWRDVPRANVDGLWQRAILHTAGRRKDVQAVVVERVARQLGAQVAAPGGWRSRAAAARPQTPPDRGRDGWPRPPAPSCPRRSGHHRRTERPRCRWAGARRDCPQTRSYRGSGRSTRWRCDRARTRTTGGSGPRRSGSPDGWAGPWRRSCTRPRPVWRRSAAAGPDAGRRAATGW